MRDTVFEQSYLHAVTRKGYWGPILTRITTVRQPQPQTLLQLAQDLQLEWNNTIPTHFLETYLRPWERVLMQVLVSGGQTRLNLSDLEPLMTVIIISDCDTLIFNQSFTSVLCYQQINW